MPFLKLCEERLNIRQRNEFNAVITPEGRPFSGPPSFEGKLRWVAFAGVDDHVRFCAGVRYQINAIVADEPEARPGHVAVKRTHFTRYSDLVHGLQNFWPREGEAVCFHGSFLVLLLLGAAAAAPLASPRMRVSKGKLKTSEIVCRYGVGAPERNDLCAVFCLRARGGHAPLGNRRGSATKARQRSKPEGRRQARSPAKGLAPCGA